TSRRTVQLGSSRMAISASRLLGPAPASARTLSMRADSDAGAVERGPVTLDPPSAKTLRSPLRRRPEPREPNLEAPESTNRERLPPPGIRYAAPAPGRRALRACRLARPSLAR